MECAGIQELLSEYIDGTLDAKDVAVVEHHISTCTACKEELIAIRAMVKELGALEPVKAPSDFLEKIHERMEARFDFSRFVRKLFVPFRVKIPLQLAAAATAAILVVLVLNVQFPEIKKMQPSKTYKVEGIAETPKADSIKPSLKKDAERPAARTEEVRERLSDGEPLSLARESKEKTVVEPLIQRKPEPSSPILTKVKPSGGRDHPIELVLMLKTGGIGRDFAPGLDMKSATMSQNDEKISENERTDKDAFRGTIKAGQKDQADDFLSTMERIIRPLDGKILLSEYYKQTERLKYVHVQIPTKNYASFCNEVNQLSVFKTPPPANIDTRLETVELLIHLTYLP